MIESIMDLELTSWIVNYDRAGLCSTVLGYVPTGDSQERSGKQLIVINDVSCLDLRSNIIKTNSGKIFKLVGPGAQSIITTHLEPFDFVKIVDDNNGEEDDKD
jgi:hypothetical protein